ncbi:uncharacterized protein LOC103096518 [Monodelphis domestica]|uniref:uncharacterized protein LOC103096518 n=1 Tax=Monodelphis domestica TaxID=13616 RepID=UPI0024E2226B|nr:uncharacterized protein LOC103096518 [Monodelphis domestica]
MIDEGESGRWTLVGVSAPAVTRVCLGSSSSPSIENERPRACLCLCAPLSFPSPVPFLGLVRNTRRLFSKVWWQNASKFAVCERPSPCLPAEVRAPGQSREKQGSEEAPSSLRAGWVGFFRERDLGGVGLKATRRRRWQRQGRMTFMLKIKAKMTTRDSIPKITMETAGKYLSALEMKSLGSEELHLWVLKKVEAIIDEPLSVIFESSWKTEE